MKVRRTYIIFSIKERSLMPWVTFDLNQFKGRAVSEDELPNYLHREVEDDDRETEEAEGGTRPALP